MPSTVWKGSLSFGLVNIPVGLYSATSDRTIRFNQFQRGTSDRVRNKRVNERTGDEVPFHEIVKGYDLGGGDFVLMEPEELDAIAPEKSRSIEIVSFVDQADIDPIYYRSTYYLAPDGEAAARAYALLREAMEEAGKVAVATLVMRNKEYLVTIRPTEEVLALETMYFADEVRDPSSELPSLPADDGFTDKELATAQLLLDSMARPWDPGEYHDTYRERVEEMIARKREGEDIVSQAPEPELSPVVDLMEALQASIARAGVGEGAGEAATGTEGGRARRSSRAAGRASSRSQGGSSRAKSSSSRGSGSSAKKSGSGSSAKRSSGGRSGGRTTGTARKTTSRRAASTERAAPKAATPKRRAS